MTENKATKESCKNCMHRRYYCPYAFRTDVYYGNVVCDYYKKETEYTRYNSATRKFETIKKV